MAGKGEVDPHISDYFRMLAQLRRHPYHGFENKDLAAKAGRLGAQRRWHDKHHPPQDDDPANGHEPREDDPSPQDDAQTPQWQ